MRRQYLIAALLMAAGPLFGGNDARGREEAEPATYCLYEIGRLPGLPPGEISLELVGINNRNQIVGWTGLAGMLIRLFGFLDAQQALELGREAAFRATQPRDKLDSRKKREAARKPGAGRV